MTKILIVDDSEFSRRILRRILEAAGHHIIEAEDGTAGIERYNVEKPDLVLLDLTMPGPHGLDVLRQIRETDSTACVIIATADVQRSSRELAEAAGACNFITKPFVEEAVLTAVNVALSGGDHGPQ